MQTLLAFLGARLDEDEAAAKAATQGPWEVNDLTYAETIYSPDGTAVVAGGRWGGEASVFDSTEDAIHIARHDPARVLREVEATRGMLDRYARLVETYERNRQALAELQADIERDERGEPIVGNIGTRARGIQREEDYLTAMLGEYRELIRQRAAVYRDHPDYSTARSPAVSSSNASSTA